MQKILYIDQNYNYIVYSYIKGDVLKTVKDPVDTINKVKDLLASYKIYNHPKFGYFKNLKDTWGEFLISEIIKREKIVKDYIKDNTIVYEAIDKIKNLKFDKKLLHGDLGVHNFIQTDKLVGIIDPHGLIGDDLFELMFCIVSNVNFLKV